MSEEESARMALRDRLIWLRTLGVGEIAGAGPEPVAPAASPAVGRRAAAAGRGAAEETGPETATQTDLFGSLEPAERTVPATGGRRRTRGSLAGAPASPLASFLASFEASGAADAAAGLALIREEMGDCERCRLHEKRTNIVFGVGDPKARLMFIGEGPGGDEDRRGEPFVGRAGQLLTRIIEAMGLQRRQVYIANVVKCRPPENRTPLPDEVITCSPFLFRQIAAIRPRVIVCLGTPAAQTVLATRETITRMRGAFREVDGIRIMPTFHPAYLLRNPAAKKDVWEDMKEVMACLKSEE